jgi:hypothetical protein
MATPQERRDQVSVPMDTDLRAAIEQVAEVENRSVAGQIRHWIAQGPRQAARAQQSAAMSGTDGTVELGPKMTALPETQRKFVLALFNPDLPPKGKGMHLMAARLAGYGKTKDGSPSTDAVVRAIAGRVLSDKRVQAAIAEYSTGAVRAMAPEAVLAVRHLLRDRLHRDHAKVALAVLEKVDPTPRAPMVQVVNTYQPPSPAMTAELVKEIAALAARAGVKLPPPVIEGEATEVEES